MHPLSYSALTTRVKVREVLGFISQLCRNSLSHFWRSEWERPIKQLVGAPRKTAGQKAVLAIRLFGLLMMSFAMIPLLLILFVGLFTLIFIVPKVLYEAARTAPVSETLTVTGWVVAIAAVVMWLIGYRIAKILRYNKFASDNNITQLSPSNNSHTGLIFDIGYPLRFDPGMQLHNQAETSFGNYRWAKNFDFLGKEIPIRRSLGFISIRISRKLPHVVLDATQNNFISQLSNLPAKFKQAQRISLEGDFDRYFTVYCPDGYGPDTLYWLTPELMEILKHQLAGYDIEVVGDHVYLYPSGLFKFDQPSIENIIGISEWLYQEFEQNTHLYRDERVGSYQANIISSRGRRLRTRLTFAAILSGVLWALYLLFILFVETR